MPKRKKHPIDNEKPFEKKGKEKDRKKSRIDETSVEEDHSAFAVLADETFLYLLSFVDDVHLYRLLMVSKRCRDIATAAIEENLKKVKPNYRNYTQVYFETQWQSIVRAAEDLIVKVVRFHRSVRQLTSFPIIKENSAICSIISNILFHWHIKKEDELKLFKIIYNKLKRLGAEGKNSYYKEHVEIVCYMFIGILSDKVLEYLLVEDDCKHAKLTIAIGFLMEVLLREDSIDYKRVENLPRMLALFSADNDSFQYLEKYNSYWKSHEKFRNKIGRLVTNSQLNASEKGKRISPILHVFAFLYSKGIFTTISEEEFKADYIQQEDYIKLYEAEKEKIEAEIVCDNPASFKLT